MRIVTCASPGSATGGGIALSAAIAIICAPPKRGIGGAWVSPRRILTISTFGRSSDLATTAAASLIRAIASGHQLALDLASRLRRQLVEGPPTSKAVLLELADQGQQGAGIERGQHQALASPPALPALHRLVLVDEVALGLGLDRRDRLRTVERGRHLLVHLALERARIAAAELDPERGAETVLHDHALGGLAELEHDLFLGHRRCGHEQGGEEGEKAEPAHGTSECLARRLGRLRGINKAGLNRDDGLGADRAAQAVDRYVPAVDPMGARRDQEADHVGDLFEVT